MPPKKYFFARAIDLLKKNQPAHTEPVIEKTLKERARDKLREIGIDRTNAATFGHRLDIAQKIFQPSFNIEFQKQQPFDENAQTKYVSNPDNWVLVHATNYVPKDNHIQTTAIASNYSVPRATVHFTLNHIVTAHMGGNWDNRPVVILTPYKDAVHENGNPAGFALVDTYFSPDADSGFKLPQTTRIIKPGNVPDGFLFQIKDNETIYKKDNYTDNEIKEILSIMAPQDREIYNNLANGILDEQQLYDVLHFDFSGQIEKNYKAAKDKQAFLAGIMAETRYEMLTHFVRQMAVHYTMNRMGFKEITQIADNTDVSKHAAKTAFETGIAITNSSNKGHSVSLYALIEDISEFYQMFNNECKQIQTKKELMDFITINKKTIYEHIFKILEQSVVKNIPTSAKQIYDMVEQQFQQDYKSHNYTEIFGEYAGIQKFDVNLDKTLKRYCEYQAQEMNKITEYINQRPELKQTIINNYLSNHHSQNNFYDR